MTRLARVGVQDGWQVARTPDVARRRLPRAGEHVGLALPKRGGLRTFRGGDVHTWFESDRV